MTKKDYNPSKAHQDVMKKNPIEEAIGDRAKMKKLDPKTKLVHDIVTSGPNPSMNNLDPENPPIPQPLEQAQTLDEPSPLEMLTLEELNRQTEERLQDNPILDEKLTQEEQRILNQRKPTIPVSKPDLQPATKTSSPASPPQKIDDSSKKAFEITKNVKDGPTVSSIREFIKENPEVFPPAEDVELTALRKYILEDGFVLATVAMHIVSLCAQPMTTPSTTTWDFKDRASIPDMVLALLNQPGYLEGIWPSLKIVMGSNAGNAAWTAGISTTIAFFDVVRTLPALKELQNEEK